MYDFFSFRSFFVIPDSFFTKKYHVLVYLSILLAKYVYLHNIIFDNVTKVKIFLTKKVCGYIMKKIAKRGKNYG